MCVWVCVCVHACIATPCTDPEDQPKCGNTLPATPETSAQVLHLHCIVLGTFSFNYEHFLFFLCVYICFCLHSLQVNAVVVEEECTSVSGGKRERDKSKVSLSTQLTVKGAPDCLRMPVVWDDTVCLRVWVFKVMALKIVSITVFPLKINWGHIQVVFLSCSLWSQDRLLIHFIPPFSGSWRWMNTLMGFLYAWSYLKCHL